MANRDTPSRQPPPPPRSAMARPATRMPRAEFEALAGIGKTTFFSLLDDPAVRNAVDYHIGVSGRADMDRAKALRFIRSLRNEQAARNRERLGRLGAYLVRPCPQCHAQITRKAGRCPHCDAHVEAATDAPPRGRPCPGCRRRITRKACNCRHCGLPVPPAAPGG